MSADDQAFLDVLSSVPNDIRKYSSNVADYIDSHLERVAHTLRDALSHAQWLPESARPRSPLPPPRSFIPTDAVSSPLSAQVYRWVLKHKILSTVIVLALGHATYVVVKRRGSRKKRRARKANNGARLEVVVIAGSPADVLTKSVALDLERRGFIVYIVCHTIEDEMTVQNESRPDIKPLMIDIADTASATASIERFKAHLQSPHAAYQGAKPHHLSFNSLIILPARNYPTGPIATLSPGTLSDLMNARFLTPVLTLQAFLPLLQALPLRHPEHHASTTSKYKPSVLVLTPNIISSLKPAFFVAESSIVGALNAFVDVLSAELSPLSIPVTHFRLGTVENVPLAPPNKELVVQGTRPWNGVRSKMLEWDESLRHAYGKNYAAVCTTHLGGNGSPMRELHNAIFDAMSSRKGGVVHVGMGSNIYGLVGKWFPRGLVAWMMGVRKISYDQEFGRTARPGSLDGSRSTSPGSGGSKGLHGLGESEYVSVFDERRGEKLPMEDQESVMDRD